MDGARTEGMSECCCDVSCMRCRINDVLPHCGGDMNRVELDEVFWVLLWDEVDSEDVLMFFYGFFV